MTGFYSPTQNTRLKEVNLNFLKKVQKMRKMNFLKREPKTPFIIKWSGEIMKTHLIIMGKGRKQPQMKQPLLQPTPPHSPQLPMWKWCMRQLPPLSLVTKELLLPLSTLESVRLPPPSTSLPRLLSNSLLHPTLGNRSTPTPLGHRGRKKEIKMPLHTNQGRRW
jgi:hypothetical protein